MLIVFDHSHIDRAMEPSQRKAASVSLISSCNYRRVKQDGGACRQIVIGMSKLSGPVLIGVRFAGTCADGVEAMHVHEKSGEVMYPGELWTRCSILWDDRIES